MKDYVERVSAAQIPPTYDRNAPVDVILKNIDVQVFDLNKIVENDALETSLGLKESCIVELVCSDAEALTLPRDYHINLDNKNNVYGFCCVSNKLPEADLIRLLTPILSVKTCCYMTMLDLSYTILPFSLFEILCKTLNVLVSGYCPIKRLLLNRCGLGLKGGLELFENIYSNLYLEELFLNGNSLTDACVDGILGYLGNTTVCKLSIISLADNKLSVKGLSRIGRALKNNKCLHTIHLQDNCPSTLNTTAHMVETGDEAGDDLFSALTLNHVLHTLNMSNCNLHKCIWADHLRICTYLNTLYLGYNQIDDQGMQLLCDAIAINCSIRYCDISHNIINGKTIAPSIGNMIKANKTLRYLNISGNILNEEAWSGIGFGLGINKSLMVLDCQWCELSLRNGEVLVNALALNPIVSIQLHNNPLPLDMIDRPRDYKIFPNDTHPDMKPVVPTRVCTIQNQSTEDMDVGTHINANLNRNDSQPTTPGNKFRKTKAGETGFNTGKAGSNISDTSYKNPVPILPQIDASLLDMEAFCDGVEYRKVRQFEIENAQAALRMVVESGHSATQTNTKSDSNSSDHTAFNSVAPTRLGSFDEHMGSKNALVSRLEHDTGLSIHHQEHILSGNVQAQQERLKSAIVEASIVRNRRVLTIAYGHSTEEIGTVEVTHQTTYADMHRLVKPLVASYLANNHQALIQDLLENYSLLDGAGVRVEAKDAPVRFVSIYMYF